MAIGRPGFGALAVAVKDENVPSVLQAATTVATTITQMGGNIFTEVTALEPKQKVAPQIANGMVYHRKITGISTPNCLFSMAYIMVTGVRLTRPMIDRVTQCRFCRCDMSYSPSG